jgi:hypothetical protein
MSVWSASIGLVVYLALAWCLGFFVLKSIQDIRATKDVSAAIWIMLAVLWAILIIKWTVRMNK